MEGGLDSVCSLFGISTMKVDGTHCTGKMTVHYVLINFSSSSQIIFPKKLRCKRCCESVCGFSQPYVLDDNVCD